MRAAVPCQWAPQHAVLCSGSVRQLSCHGAGSAPCGDRTLPTHLARRQAHPSTAAARDTAAAATQSNEARCRPASQSPRSASQRTEGQPPRTACSSKNADAAHPVVGAAAAAAALTGLTGAAWAEAGGAAPGPASPPAVFTPGTVEVGWEIWFGAVVATVPFVIGAYEFGKRILIQRRCGRCGGSGLVPQGRFQRKCPACGSFFPWRGWGEFLSATAAPGNGGRLRAPQGQTSVFYKVPPRDSEGGSGPEVAEGGEEDSKEGRKKDS